jgi:gluconolactonase
LSGRRGWQRLDQRGNGVHGIAPDGSKLGVIKVPFTVSNLTFCDRKPVPAIYLRVPTLYAIYTNQRGASGPKAARRPWPVSR